MTLTELRYIVALAREHHFGRAAEACFVSQPTLSVAVKKLEDELGVALFERGKTEVAVTPVGERIVEQARRVLDELEGVKRIAQQARDPLAGPLRIGAIYTVGPYLFPRLVPILHESAPRMPLIIEEQYTARLRVRRVCRRRSTAVCARRVRFCAHRHHHLFRGRRHGHAERGTSCPEAGRCTGDRLYRPHQRPRSILPSPPGGEYFLSRDEVLGGG